MLDAIILYYINYGKALPFAIVAIILIIGFLWLQKIIVNYSEMHGDNDIVILLWMVFGIFLVPLCIVVDVILLMAVLATLVLYAPFWFPPLLVFSIITQLSKP